MHSGNVFIENDECDTVFLAKTSLRGIKIKLTIWCSLHVGCVAMCKNMKMIYTFLSVGLNVFLYPYINRYYDGNTLILSNGNTMVLEYCNHLLPCNICNQS